MPLYGRGFVVQDPKKHGFYETANQPLPAGPYTREAGIWGYNEVKHSQFKKKSNSTKISYYLLGPLARFVKSSRTSMTGPSNAILTTCPLTPTDPICGSVTMIKNHSLPRYYIYESFNLTKRLITLMQIRPSTQIWWILAALWSGPSRRTTFRVAATANRSSWSRPSWTPWTVDRLRSSRPFHRSLRPQNRPPPVDRRRLPILSTRRRHLNQMLFAKPKAWYPTRKAVPLSTIASPIPTDRGLRTNINALPEQFSAQTSTPALGPIWCLAAKAMASKLYGLGLVQSITSF